MEEITNKYITLDLLKTEYLFNIEKYEFLKLILNAVIYDIYDEADMIIPYLNSI